MPYFSLSVSLFLTLSLSLSLFLSLFLSLSLYIYSSFSLYIYVATSKILQWWIPYVSIDSNTNVITCARFRLKQMWRLTKAMAKMKWEHWNKRWNWSSCTKLALNVSWTHGLIAQSVRASERNSVVVGSNPTQANFL